MKRQIYNLPAQLFALLLLVALLVSCSTPPSPSPTAASVQNPPLLVPSAVIPVPQPGQPSATANYNTLIYSGPGENYVVYASFVGSQQAVVNGKSQDGGWWAISVPPAASGVGWVSADWVTVKDAGNVPVLPTPPVPPTTDLVPPGPGDPQANALVNTYVRTGPAISYPAYGIALAGASGRVIGKSVDNQWLVVRLDPQKVGAGHGWVASSTVQATNIENVPLLDAAVTPPEVSPPPAPPAGVPSATALEYVNVRTGPGLNYPVLLVAPPSAAGEVSGKSADGAWWQVKISTSYAADGLGWVSAAYVMTENTDSVAVVDAPPPPDVPTQPPSSDQCALVAQEPADNSVLPANSVFQMSWTLQNTSGTRWDMAEYDIRYLGSTSIRLHEGSDVYDLQSTVEPGWTYVVAGEMIAPADPGTYSEAWAITLGNQTVCPFWVTIVVQ